jgi:hypothetical protein
VEADKEGNAEWESKYRAMASPSLLKGRLINKSIPFSYEDFPTFRELPLPGHVWSKVHTDTILTPY